MAFKLDRIISGRNRGNISTQSLSPILKDTSSVNSDTVELLMNSQEDTVDRLIAEKGLSMSPFLTDDTTTAQRTFVYDSAVKEYLATPVSPLAPKNKFSKPKNGVSKQSSAVRLSLQSSSGDENSLTGNTSKRKLKETFKGRKKSKMPSLSGILSSAEKTDASLFRSPVEPPVKGKGFRRKQKTTATDNAFAGILDTSDSESSFSASQLPVRGRLYQRKTISAAVRFDLDDAENSTGSELSFHAKSRKKSMFRINPKNSSKRKTMAECLGSFTLSNSSDTLSQETAFSQGSKHSNQGKKFKKSLKEDRVEGCKEFGDALLSDSSVSCKSANLSTHDSVNSSKNCSTQKSNVSSHETSTAEQDKSVSLTNLDISKIEPDKPQNKQISGHKSISSRSVGGSSPSPNQSAAPIEFDVSKREAQNSAQSRMNGSSLEKSLVSHSRADTEELDESVAESCQKSLRESQNGSYSLRSQNRSRSVADMTGLENKLLQSHEKKSVSHSSDKNYQKGRSVVESCIEKELHNSSLSSKSQNNDKLNNSGMESSEKHRVMDGSNISANDDATNVTAASSHSLKQVEQVSPSPSSLRKSSRRGNNSSVPNSESVIEGSNICANDDATNDTVASSHSLKQVEQVSPSPSSVRKSSRRGNNSSVPSSESVMEGSNISANDDATNDTGASSHSLKQVEQVSPFPSSVRKSSRRGNNSSVPSSERIDSSNLITEKNSNQLSNSVKQTKPVSRSPSLRQSTSLKEERPVSSLERGQNESILEVSSDPAKRDATNDLINLSNSNLSSDSIKQIECVAQSPSLSRRSSRSSVSLNVSSLQAEKLSHLKESFEKTDKSKNPMIINTYVAGNLSRSYSLRSQLSVLSDSAPCENTSVVSVSGDNRNRSKAGSEISVKMDRKSLLKENSSFSSETSVAASHSKSGEPKLVLRSETINFQNCTFNSENELTEKRNNGIVANDKSDSTYDSPGVHGGSKARRSRGGKFQNVTEPDENCSTTTNTNEEPDDMPSGNSSLPSYRLSKLCPKFSSNSSSSGGRESSAAKNFSSKNSSISKKQLSFQRNSSIRKRSSDGTSPTIVSDYSTVAEFSLLASNQFDSDASQFDVSDESLVRRSVRVSDRVSDNIVRNSPLPNITELDYEVTANSSVNDLAKSTVEENMRLHISDEPHVRSVNLSVMNSCQTTANSQSSKTLNKTIDNSDIAASHRRNSNKKTSLEKSVSPKVMNQSGSNQDLMMINVFQCVDDKGTSLRKTASPKVPNESFKNHLNHTANVGRTSTAKSDSKSSLNASLRKTASPKVPNESFKNHLNHTVNVGRTSTVKSDSKSSLNVSVDGSKSFEDGSFETTAGEGTNLSRRSLRISKSSVDKTNSYREPQDRNPALSLETDLTELSTRESSLADDSVSDSVNQSSINSVHINATESDVDEQSANPAINTEVYSVSQVSKNISHGNLTDAGSVNGSNQSHSRTEEVSNVNGSVTANSPLKEMDSTGFGCESFLSAVSPQVGTGHLQRDLNDSSKENSSIVSSFGSKPVSSCGSQFDNLFRKPNPLPPRLRKLQKSQSFSSSGSPSTSLFSKCVRSKKIRRKEKENSNALLTNSHNMALRKRNAKPAAPPVRLIRPAYWVTNRLYSFLIDKLEPVYNITSRRHAEKFVQFLQEKCRQLVKEEDEESCKTISDTIKERMIELRLVNSDFMYYNFFQDFLPLEIEDKVVPCFKPFSDCPGEINTSVFSKYF